MTHKLITACALIAFGLLAACGGEDGDVAENVQAQADEEAELIEARAENLLEQADNATAEAADAIENEAAELEAQADATSEAGENKADAIDAAR